MIEIEIAIAIGKSTIGHKGTPQTYVLIDLFLHASLADFGLLILLAKEGRYGTLS